jgi:predicted aldo/keto reductase-like oxidoreductase
MEYRTLGRTGEKVGIIGLGTEYLEKAPEDTVVSVVHRALDAGVSYIDLWMATPDVRSALGKALKGRRGEAFVAGHIGPVLSEGKTDISRDPTAAGRCFENFLTRLGSDHVDVAMLFMVDAPEDYERVIAPGGTADLAVRCKKEGKTRFIGMSSHYAPTALKAVRSGLIDVLMFPVNPAFDLVPPTVRIEALWEKETYTKAAEKKESAVSVKRELYMECVRRDVAVIAMKPFAAGWLFRKDNPSGISLTPVKCLHYALSQPGVVAAVPGCRSVQELEDCLSYLEADNAGREYGDIADNELWKLQGACMYCGHCLPCPAGIEIDVITRLLDEVRSGRGPDAALRAEYRALDRSGGDCTECGDCMKRCPFAVDVVANMRRAMEIFV